MEFMAHDLREMQRLHLASAHIAALRTVGKAVSYPAGAMLARSGDPVDRFAYVETGEVEVVDPFTNRRHLPSTLRSGQFLGEISLLDGGNWSMSMRAVCDTVVIEVARTDVLTLMSQAPEMSDIIITVLAARRRSHLEAQDGAIVLIGEEVDRTVRHIAEFTDRNRIPYTSLPLEAVETAAVARSCGLSPGQPAVIFGKAMIPDPTPEKVARLLGLNRELRDDEAFDLLIVGGGPAGVAAGVYAGAEGLRALVIEDTAIGGQAGTSSRIENYMGFPTGISGGDLVWRGEIQAMKFGTRFAMPRRVVDLEPQADGSFCASFDNGRRVRGGAIVVATGVQYRRLPLDRLADFEGVGVYYAATEMEARRCRDTEAVIVGGGNSAGQAAMFLSRSAKAVRLLVRGPSLAASMSRYLSSRLEVEPAITIDYGVELAALQGGDTLEGVVIRNVATGSTETISTKALFIMIGAAPNMGWLRELVQLNERGFVKTGASVGSESPYATSHAGIFAVGDVRAGSVKRVASAVGEGSVVISKVWTLLKA